MIFSDVTDKLKFDRSLAINAITTLNNSKGVALGFNSWNTYYLNGDTLTPTNHGVNDLIYYYIKEKFFLVGDSFYYPRIAFADSLPQWRTKWTTIQNNATSPYGDGIYGLFPPDVNGVAASTMNMNSHFLNNQGGVYKWYGDTRYGDTRGGLFGRINQVLKELGDSATGAKGVYTSPGTYADSATARKAARLYVYGDSATAVVRPPMTNRALTGLGIEGRRTCSDTIYCYNTVAGGPYNFRVGTSAITTSITNFYGDSTDKNGMLGNHRTRLLSALADLIAYADTTAGPYFRMLKGLRAEIIHIKGDSAGDTNAIFKTPEMWRDVGDSKNYLSFYMSNLAGVIGKVADSYGKGTAADSSIYGCYRYFTAIPGGTGKSADYRFQQVIMTLRNKLKFRYNLNSLYGGCSSRYWKIENILGTAGASPTRLRKWRYYWLNAIVGKPVSSLVSYNGIDFAITSSTNQKGVVEYNMAQLMGSAQANLFQYIPTPTTYATYLDPIRDAVTGQILQRRITTVFGGQAHATSYWIYKMQAPSPSSSTIAGTTGWGDTMGDTYHYATITALDPKTGYVQTTYTDNSISTGDSVEIFSLDNSLNVSSFGRSPIINTMVLEQGKFGKLLNPSVKWAKSNVYVGKTDTNLLSSTEDMTASPWGSTGGFVTASNYYDSISGITFGKLLSDGGSTSRSLYQNFTPGASTLGISIIMKKGNAQEGSWSVYDTIATAHQCLFRITSWTARTYSVSVGTLNNAKLEWFDDNTVRITGSIPISNPANNHALNLYPTYSIAEAKYTYYAKPMIAASNYSVPYVSGTRSAGGISYNYNWTQQGTIEGWVKPYFNYDVATNHKYIWSNYDLSTVRIRLLYDISADKYNFIVYDGSTTVSLTSAKITNNTNLQQWTYIKAIWDIPNGVYRLITKSPYLNGDTSTNAALSAINFSPYLEFGGIPQFSSPTNYEFDGLLTDFAIYPYANTDMTLYNSRLPHIATFSRSLGYIYRVKVIDENNKVNGDTTASLQSYIYRQEGDSFYRVMADSIISFGHKPIFTRGQAAVINNTISHNGYYQITNVGDSFVNIYPTIPVSSGDSTGLIYPCLSVAFVQ